MTTYKFCTGLSFAFVVIRWQDQDSVMVPNRYSEGNSGLPQHLHLEATEWLVHSALEIKSCLACGMIHRQSDSVFLF